MRSGFCLSPDCLVFGAECAEKQLLRNEVVQLRNGNQEHCETGGENGVWGMLSIGQDYGKGEGKLGITGEESEEV